MAAKNEDLQVTSKGSKALAGGKRLHVMVAMKYRHGVIVREPYEKLNGKLCQFHKGTFSEIFVLDAQVQRGIDLVNL